MHSTAEISACYANLLVQARALFAGESDLIANAANLAALVFGGLPGLNWAGLYRFDGAQLLLGPFQGRPACARIALGRGVCGSAAMERRTQMIADVHAFPGHIACDAASRSEIVVPLIDADGRLLGVWDVDSPLHARFGEADRIGMEALCAALVEAARSGAGA
ncbi:GAF domain-containing protein [Acidihalobacter prosperus]|uniref:Diguanylate cyclase n=1 Tax=Acidihalobacter prosperus TaxID=160660 RepID=A0A1A6C698_9GAMM|nr:GAF domain-containing protein [Acidihalobacter prosperus]OBS10088.1 diguanylate cyclase [Acidihalobacter prosperus]